MRARKAAAVGPSRVIKSSRDCSPPSQKEKRLREEDVDALDGVFSPTLTLGGFMDIDLGSEEDKERVFEEKDHHTHPLIHLNRYYSRADTANKF